MKITSQKAGITVVRIFPRRNKIPHWILLWLILTVALATIWVHSNRNIQLSRGNSSSRIYLNVKDLPPGIEDDLFTPQAQKPTTCTAYHIISLTKVISHVKNAMSPNSLLRNRAAGDRSKYRLGANRPAHSTRTQQHMLDEVGPWISPRAFSPNLVQDSLREQAVSRINKWNNLIGLPMASFVSCVHFSWSFIYRVQICNF